MGIGFGWGMEGESFFFLFCLSFGMALLFVCGERDGVGVGIRQ